MANRFVKFGFVAGVLAPGYQNRTDLEKFDLGLEQGTNWFVDYQGGLTSRPGLEFCDFIKLDRLNVLTTPFQYGFDIANTNLIMFGDEYIRFVQDGAYVLEPKQDVTDIVLDVVEIVGHGYEDGDWVKPFNFGVADLKYSTLVIANKTADTFELKDVYENFISFDSWNGAGRFARVYTLDSPFNSARVPYLKFHQVRDTLRITSSRRQVRPYDLTRLAAASWTLDAIEIENSVSRPTGLVVTGEVDSSPPGHEMIYTVTAVSKTGEESLAADSYIVSGLIDFSATAGSATLEWDKQDDIAYYNVYRSIIGRDDNLSRAQELGYLGRAYGPQFHDYNIIPDFTTTPPVSNNPFADSKIQFINVTHGGAGYTNDSVLSVADVDGTGFQGYPVVFGGKVLAIVVVNGGQDYTAPVISLTIGAGATFTTELGEAEGNIPSVGAIFQQRQVFASTDNEPLTVFGSKPKQLNNFDFSSIVLENDSYNFELDNEIVESIRHLLPTREGLLIATESGMWQLTGSSGGPVTATDVLASRQSFNGVAEVAILQINEDIMVLDADGTAARMLTYSDFARSYNSSDVTILANHYFSETNFITSWNYFTSPHRLVLGTREDGSVVCGCVVKEHGVFAWSDWNTQGFFRHVARLREETVDRAYFIVERYVNGENRKYLERLAPRKFTNIEEVVCLDSAVSCSPNYISTAVTPNGLTGTIVLESNAAAFSPSDVDRIFRGGGGRGVVTEYINAFRIRIVLEIDITLKVPNTDIPYRIAQDTWSLDEPTDTIYGLDHLEGQTVNALIDGQVFKDLLVTNARYTHSEPFTRYIIGLGYECLGKALTPNATQDLIEDSRKRIVGVAMWQNETRGMKVGTRLSKMYEFKERSTESYNLTAGPQYGMTFVSLDPVWETYGTLYFKQDNPLPASLLGWIMNVELGDDDDRK